MKRRTLVQQYLEEVIDYGGEPYTRGEAILHMQSIGLNQSNIDRWLQGYELGQRLRTQRAHSAMNGRNDKLRS
jgi:hypothetical protein